MAKRLAELGALQDAVSNNESNPSRLGLAGYIRGLFLDWSANPYNPLTRLSARGRLLGYFWDNGAVGLSMDFANQSFIVKDGTLQSKSFSDIVNFSRTSNATITNSAGVISYAPHNLLLASEQFDSSSWVNNASSEQSNVILSPNNTITADKLIEDSTTDVHTTTQTLTKVASVITYTYSIYVKGGLGRNVQLSLDGGTTTNRSTANFDIANGVVGSVLNFGTFTAGSNQIEALSNNWYRCSLTTTTGTETSIRAQATLLNGTTSSYAGDGTSGIYLWGAQLEIGSTATTYNPTTVKNLLGYSELFDNAAWTKSNSFVQTNLLTYSEAFDNAAWSKTLSSVTANSEIAPNGYQTADKFIPNSGSQGNIISAAVTVSSATTITASIYFKPDGLDQFTYWYGGLSSDRTGVTVTTATNAITSFTLGAGVAPTSSSITPVGSGWYRLIFTTVTPNANGQMGIRYLGSTTANGTNGIFIWGAQVVQGSVAGDYRRTDAAALPIYYANHNGVVCAEQLHGTAANATILESYTASGAPMTFSVWMRRITGTGNVDITMDTGVTWTTQSITTSWARYSITSTPASGARTAGIRLVTSGDIIQVFGGQVSPSASLDPYVLNAAAAPSAAAYYGARFDYDPVTLAPKGLLIEEQRANLLLNSSIAGTNLATQNVTVTAVAHTLSFYGTGQIVLSGTSSATVVGDGAYPTRKTLTFTPTAGTLTLTVTGTVQYAQLEIGSFATSFIPTAASQVTRTADVATIQGSNFYSWYNQNEGSIYSNADTYLVPPTTNSYIYGITDGTVNNTYISYVNLTGTEIRYIINYVGPAQSTIVSSGITSNTFFKHAAAYKINDVAGVLNNGTVGIDTSVNTPIVTKIILGSGDTANRSLNGHIKQISYYPQRLSNDVLKGLTA